MLRRLPDSRGLPLPERPATATCLQHLLDVTHRVPVGPHPVHQHYRDRLGLKTSDRLKNHCRIRTTTQKPLLRLLFVALAFVLVHLWGALCFGLTSASLNAMDGAFCRRTFDTKPCWSFSRIPLSDISPGVVRCFAPSRPSLFDLLSLVKQLVYLPPRSINILLQEFITRDPNDVDVAMVYESIALCRWQQAQPTQGQPYQIYYLNPTLKTISTTAISTRAARTLTAVRAARVETEVFIRIDASG